MIKSKEWDWNIVQGETKKSWLQPASEAYYLLNRWSKLGKKNYLDLGSGLGRHTILFAENGFNTSAFDLSELSVEKTRELVLSVNPNLKVNYDVGDMLNLPYKKSSFDAIMCYKVISHTDTEGMKKIISELYRVLKKGGECFLTLGSKDTWGYKETDWPLVDPNTKIRMEEGPEYGVPHFYADYALVHELFKDFEIIEIYERGDFVEKNGKTSISKHFHVLIKKP